MNDQIAELPDGSGALVAEIDTRPVDNEVYERRYRREQLVLALLPFYGSQSEDLIAAARTFEAFVEEK